MVIEIKQCYDEIVAIKTTSKARKGYKYIKKIIAYRIFVFSSGISNFIAKTKKNLLVTILNPNNPTNLHMIREENSK